MTRRTGRQEPTFQTSVQYVYTDGPEAVAMFRDYGIDFIPAQELELSAMLARDADGRPAAITVGLSRPRQNGKSYGALYYSAWMAAVEGRNVLYSAHNGKTVRKFFKQLCVLFDSPAKYPDWYSQVDKIVKVKGEEGIYLRNGAYIEFSTRTNGGARGGTYSVIIIDEAQELTDVQLEALLPTASATGDIPQIIYIGTPPNEACHGTVFRRFHTQAHSGNPGSLWWMEWGVDDLPPADATESQLIDLAYETNPMLGYRMYERSIRNEIESMSREGYARERLNWWSPDIAGYERVVKPSTWAKCATDHPLKVGKVAYGVKYSPDGTRAAVCAARMSRTDPEAPVHVELVRLGDITHGARWIGDFLLPRAEVASCYWADGKGRADNLEKRLRQDGAPKLYCHTCGTRDVISAAGAFQEGVNAHAITHFSQQSLTDSVTLSCRRQIGDKYSGGFSFGSVDGIADSTVAEAAALAYQAVRTSYRDPEDVEEVVSW